MHPGILFFLGCLGVLTVGYVGVRFYRRHYGQSYTVPSARRAVRNHVGADFSQLDER